MKFGQLIEYKMIGVRKNAPEKKPHAKNPPKKLPPGKLRPGNMTPRKIAPRKNAPTPSLSPEENCPLKIVLLDFCCF